MMSEAEEVGRRGWKKGSIQQSRMTAILITFYVSHSSSLSLPSLARNLALCLQVRARWHPLLPHHRNQIVFFSHFDSPLSPPLLHFRFSHITFPSLACSTSADLPHFHIAIILRCPSLQPCTVRIRKINPATGRNNDEVRSKKDEGTNLYGCGEDGEIEGKEKGKLDFTLPSTLSISTRNN